MPTTNPTGYETYIYDHKEYRAFVDRREFRGPTHDPEKLPLAECHDDSIPFIMIEPCYASRSNKVWICFRNGPSFMISRYLAEQLRDALIKVCEKPLI